MKIPTRGTLLCAGIHPRTPCPAIATHPKQQTQKLLHLTGSSTSWRNPPSPRTARGLSGNFSRSSGVKTGYRAGYGPCIMTVVAWSSTTMVGSGAIRNDECRLDGCVSGLRTSIWMHDGGSLAHLDACGNISWTPWTPVCTSSKRETRNCDRYQAATVTDMVVVVWLNKQHA